MHLGADLLVGAALLNAFIHFDGECLRDQAKRLERVASSDVRRAMGAALAGAVSQADYEAAIWCHRPRLQAAYRNYFRAHRLDAMLTMTTPLPACPVGDDEATLLEGRRVPVFETYI